MHNQCSGLYICIINYLYLLYTIFMVLSCVLCMTLMLFIYVYYGLFVCTNLLDVMSLFFMIFRSIYRFLIKIDRFRHKPPGNRHAGFLKNPSDLSVFLVSLFLRRLRCVSTEFS
jgi:hypothetical protein